MKFSIPITLLLSLATYHCLSHAAPLRLPLRSRGPLALDYPVVNVADPGASVPDFVLAGDGDGDGVVTRTTTQAPSPPSTATSRVTDDVPVSVVDIRETDGPATPLSQTPPSPTTSATPSPTAAASPSEEPPTVTRTPPTSACSARNHDGTIRG